MIFGCVGADALNLVIYALLAHVLGRESKLAAV